MARHEEQCTIARPSPRCRGVVRTHRPKWSRLALALLLLCMTSLPARGESEPVEPGDPALAAGLPFESPESPGSPEPEKMEADAAVGAIPATDPTDEVAPGPGSDEAARERNDALDERREDLEKVEEQAPETLRISDLPKPCSGPWDWVHLSSGEWLRGEFKRMRKKKFEFRSTRMKKQTIDWKHIKEFCFANETRFILYDHTVLSGRGELIGGRLTVAEGGVTQTAPRDDIWAILPGLPTELNRWRASLSAGLDAYAGNTDQQNVTGSVTIDREDPNTHLNLGYTTSFGRTDGEDNVKRHRATGQLDLYFNRRFFAIVPAVVYTSDTFQNIQQRVTPGLGLGYLIFDRDEIEWDVQAGLAYQYVQYVSVLPGQSLSENDIGPLLSTSLEWDITGDLTFKLSQSAVLLLIDFDQSNFHTQGSLIYDVTDLIYLEFSAWYDRVLQPRQTSDGSVPDPNDTRTVVSIGLNFD